MITGEEIDKLLIDRGMISINERLKCQSAIDIFARHTHIGSIHSFLQWVQSERRSVIEMIARHELGIREMDDDIADFVYGKSAVLWEVHVNLLQVMKGGWSS